MHADVPVPVALPASSAASLWRKLELRRRVEPILKKLEEWPATSPTALRAWRALEVLEHLGTPEARQLLRKLADGAPEARLTREAKAALGRLDAGSITMP